MYTKMVASRVLLPEWKYNICNGNSSSTSNEKSPRMGAFNITFL